MSSSSLNKIDSSSLSSSSPPSSAAWAPPGATRAPSRLPPPSCKATPPRSSTLSTRALPFTTVSVPQHEHPGPHLSLLDHDVVLVLVNQLHNFLDVHYGAPLLAGLFLDSCRALLHSREEVGDGADLGVEALPDAVCMGGGARAGDVSGRAQAPGGKDSPAHMSRGEAAALRPQTPHLSPRLREAFSGSPFVQSRGRDWPPLRRRAPPKQAGRTSIPRRDHGSQYHRRPPRPHG